MNNSKYNEKYFFFIGFILAVISLFYLIAYAATSYRVNSGATTTIDEWSVCKKVTNNNSLDIFVPTNTDTEWTDFRNNASGVTLAECGYYCDEDGDGHYSTTLSSSCSSGRQSSSQGDDCCDSDANAYPGQTAYFSTADACGSFDYNCNGAIDKTGGCYPYHGQHLSDEFICYTDSECSNGGNRYKNCTLSDQQEENCGDEGWTYYCDRTNCYHDDDCDPGRLHGEIPGYQLGEDDNVQCLCR